MLFKIRGKPIKTRKPAKKPVLNLVKPPKAIITLKAPKIKINILKK